MNHFIDSQIMDMIAISKTFESSCRFAAAKDDGRIDKDEAAIIKSIGECTQRFIKDLQKIQRSNVSR